MKPRLTHSLTSQHYYTLKVPCKPYIRKFATALFGDPIKADNKTTIGIIVIQSLEKNVYENRSIRDWYYKLFMKERPDLLEIEITKWQFAAIGSEFPRASMLTINRFLENSFDENLYLYTNAHIDNGKRYNGKEQSLISFAEKYGIEIAVDSEDEGDITIDALKKKESRYRNRLKKKKEFFANLSLPVSGDEDTFKACTGT
ncbi:MAG TPA: hypothetical protein VEB40_08690 [Flavipsychrobacter sp.]|nr:hypothetical protein [Flavipsychrobacter sp.]